MKIKMNLNVYQKRTELPKNVYEVLERVRERIERVSNNQNDLYITLLNVCRYGAETHGDLHVIREYAMQNPKQYINALANGYKLENTNITEQVSDLIQEWLNTEYVEDEATDIYLFADRLTEFYKEKLTKTS